jgi:D-serine deaminase-like pyridoxal phosphate-dependent protein
MTHVARLDGVTEARPGNYAFYDAMQVALSCARVEDVAVTIAASVVSHQEGASHFVVDAGALALSKDQGPAHVARGLGYGSFLSPDGGVEEGLRIDSLSQEHGIVRAASPDRIAGRFRVGDRVRILPVHSCLAVAHFDEYVLVRKGAEAGRWRIGRGR